MPFDPRFTQSNVVAAGSPGGGSQLGFKAVSSSIFLGLYDDYTGVGNNLNVTFIKTTNGGASWTPTVIETVDGSLWEVNTMSVFSTDGTNIYAFYTLTDFSDTDDQVKFAFSGDGGATWWTDTTLTTPGPQVVVHGGGTADLNDFALMSPFVADGHIFYLVGDFIAASLSVYVSTDGGVSWTSHLIDSPAYAGGAQIAGGGSRLYCFYQGQSPTFHPTVAWSTDCGVTWTPVNVANETINGGAGIGCTIDGMTLFTFWQVFGVGYRVSKSVDGGLTWGTPVTFDPAATQSASSGTPSCFLANNNEPTIVYGDSETLGGYSPDLKFAQSSNGGASWSVTFIASDGVNYYAKAQQMDAADPSTFGIFAINPADDHIILYLSNTPITGAFTASSFTCGGGPPTPTIVNGEAVAGGIVSGEAFTGGIVSGETFT